MTPTIVTGTDAAIGVQLSRNGAKFAINPSATVKALVVSSDHKTSYMATPAAVLSETPGSAWETSYIVITFPADTTSGISFQGMAMLEIKVDDSLGVGKKTWFTPVKIITGQIQ